MKKFFKYIWVGVIFCVLFGSISYLISGNVNVSVMIVFSILVQCCVVVLEYYDGIDKYVKLVKAKL